MIIDLCEPSAEEERAAIAKSVDQDATKGYRTLGVARTDETGKWRFLGLLPLFDPPRDDAARHIAATRAMGVDIKMVTGDHEAIAKEIAGQLKLGQNIVVAGAVFGQGDGRAGRSRNRRGRRVCPRLSRAQVQDRQGAAAAGHIVGMTGDGVNDAPAL